MRLRDGTHPTALGKITRFRSESFAGSPSPFRVLSIGYHDDDCKCNALVGQLLAKAESEQRNRVSREYGEDGVSKRDGESD